MSGFYRNLTDVLLETLKLLTISDAGLKRRIRVINAEVINRYYEANKTVIATTSHLCNWEWMLAIASLVLKAPIDGVYQEVRNPLFEKLMFRIRSRFGSQPVEKNNVFRESLKKRNIPHIIALVADQSPPFHDQNVHSTQFFNQQTVFYKGMGRLSKTFRWPVTFSAMRRLKRGHYELDFALLVDDPDNYNENEIVGLYANMTEKAIRKNPSDWLWSHNRWKRTP